MKTVMLDNPNTLKPEVGSQMPESGMAAAPATPQPPKLNLGVIGTAEELPPEEYLALLTDEQIIHDEFKNSIDVGLALIEIRDRRLYRIEYGSFAEYYQKKWRFDKRKVCFLSATAEAYKSVTTGTNLPSPEYAFQMRPLLGLAPDQARLAWELAAKKARGGKIKERLVRAAVVELQFKPEGNAERMKERRERADRRQQLSQAMADLLELIVMRKPYEELVQKASLLDQQVRFFFPKRPKKAVGER